MKERREAISKQQLNAPVMSGKEHCCWVWHSHLSRECVYFLIPFGFIATREENRWTSMQKTCDDHWRNPVIFRGELVSFILFFLANFPVISFWLLWNSNTITLEDLYFPGCILGMVHYQRYAEIKSKVTCMHYNILWLILRFVMAFNDHSRIPQKCIGWTTWIFKCNCYLAFVLCNVPILPG
jgi:hypothetical protein